MKSKLPVFFFAFAFASFAGGVATWPIPDGIDVSRDYAVRVDGVDVPVMLTPKPSHGLSEALSHPYSFAQFDADGEVEVKVTWKGGGETFRAKPPFSRTFEPFGRHRALTLAANAPERDAPKKGDPNVVWFGPGRHRVDVLELKAGQTLYLAGGALVEGAVVARGDGVSVRGRGIISGAPWPWCKGPLGEGGASKLCSAAGKVMGGTLASLSGRDLVVRDVVLWSAWGWCLVFEEAERVLVDNVKILGWRVLNDDGIDLCRVKDAVVRNSFIRSQDDCIAPKWRCENVVVSNCVLWCDHANAVRVGYECDAPPAKFSNLLFRDVDVRRLSPVINPPDAYWTHAAVQVQASNNQLFENLRFEDFRFAVAEPGDLFAVVKTMPVNVGCNFPDAGTIRNLSFARAAMPKRDGAMGVYVKAQDAAHPVEAMTIEGAPNLGPVTRVGAVDCTVR